MLNLGNRPAWDEKRKKKIRMVVHGSFAIVFLFCILIFKWINDKSIINVILELAGYTYGPLLGLFAFGIFTKRSLPDNPAVTIVCLLAPACCYILSRNAGQWFGGYQIGYELLLINGILTFLGLFLISKKKVTAN
jgi:hypothetical protein